MDAPAQDFASGVVWEETGPDSAGRRGDAGAVVPPPQPAADRQTAVAQLVGIFGEANRLTAKARLLFAGVRAGTGLTGSEVTTLVAIAHASTPQTVAQIGRYLGRPRQVVQRAIKVLERDGFITVTPNPDHKRAPLLTTRPKGRETVERIDGATRDIIDTLVDDCDVGQLGTLHAGLMALRQQVGRRLTPEDG